MKRVSKLLACSAALAMLFCSSVAFAQEDEGDDAASEALSLDEAREEMLSGDEADIENSEEGEDDEPYLSDADQDALLDEKTEAAMEKAIAQDREADSSAPSKESEKGASYIVRVEVYARPSTPYIPVGDLSLAEGYFSWCHDGKKQNGYAVFMYPASKDESAITLKGGGARLIYGKTFDSVEAASQEIQGPDTQFHNLITYAPVVNLMLEKLQQPPYQEESMGADGGSSADMDADEDNSTDRDADAGMDEDEGADEDAEADLDADADDSTDEDDGTEAGEDTGLGEDDGGDE